MNDLVVQALGRLMPGVRRGELSRDDRRLRWVEAGSGSPTVVLDAAATSLIAGLQGYANGGDAHPGGGLRPSGPWRQ
jgi:hypothetical protein